MLAQGVGGWQPVLIYRYDGFSWQPDGVVTVSLELGPLAYYSSDRLDIDEERIVLGSSKADRVFLIEQVGGVWQETARFKAEGLDGGGNFGFTAAISNNQAFASGYSNHSGAVFIWDVTDCDGDGSLDGCPGGCEQSAACQDTDFDGVLDGCEVDCDGNGTPDVRDSFTYGDTDRNCMINLVDDARLAGCVLGPIKVADIGCRRSLDFTGDERVDLRDVRWFMSLPR